MMCWNYVESNNIFLKDKNFCSECKEFIPKSIFVSSKNKYDTFRDFPLRWEFSVYIIMVKVRYLLEEDSDDNYRNRFRYNK